MSLCVKYKYCKIVNWKSPGEHLRVSCVIVRQPSRSACPGSMTSQDSSAGPSLHLEERHHII